MRVRTRAFWYDATTDEWIPVHNHAADAIADPSRFRLSHRDLATAKKAGDTFMTRRPAVIEAVIRKGFVRTRLTANGRLLVQGYIQQQRDAMAAVVIGMVERFGLRDAARCEFSDSAGSPLWSGRVVDARAYIRDGNQPRSRRLENT